MRRTDRRGATSGLSHGCPREIALGATAKELDAYRCGERQLGPTARAIDVRCGSMNGFLMTWNPKKFDWNSDELTECADASAAGKSTTWEWSCAGSRKPCRGARAFMIKLGLEGRGIFAAGTIVRGATPAPPGADYGPMFVDVTWDSFLDPRSESSLLDPFGIDGQHWIPQSSGIEIKPAALAELERRWSDHLAAHGRRPALRSFSDHELRGAHELEGLEGEIVERVIAHRRRERQLRDAKLADYRSLHKCLRCEVCGFDFAKTFGVEYAEVHHLKPLAKAGGPQKTRLIDLAVLCANCHRIAHLDPQQPKSLSALRAMRAGGAT